MKGVSMKKKILHIIVPILLTVVAYFVCTKAFYIPDPTKPNTATLYVGSKKK